MLNLSLFFIAELFPLFKAMRIEYNVYIPMPPGGHRAPGGHSGDSSRAAQAGPAYTSTGSLTI